MGRHVLVSFILGMVYKDRYFPIPAASLPFYFLRRSDVVRQRFAWVTKIVPLWFVLLLVNRMVRTWLSYRDVFADRERAFHMNLILAALLILGLVPRGRIINISTKMDTRVGDYSYLQYVVHWNAGLLASWVVFQEPAREFTSRGVWRLACALVVSLLFAWALKIYRVTVVKLTNFVLVQRRRADSEVVSGTGA